MVAPLRELRQRIGAHLADEEFLLRATMPAGPGGCNAGRGPASLEYDPSVRPLMNLIRTLAARRDLWSVSLEKAGFRLALSRSEPPAAEAI